MPRSWHLERYPGKYVAIDMKTDEVVLAAETPQELEAEIKAKRLTNVATMRAPRPDAPFAMVLDQVGLLDQFTVTVHRGAAMLALEEWSAFDTRFGGAASRSG